ncbi:hypothetical protein ACOPJQ_12080 [Luteimonas dalianensis]|uniref:hypothetical protein n=1 Tax=Luteimonas dalianensis TaxID=1148196 RepID=UPI003BF22202
MRKNDLETTLRHALIHDWGYVVGSAGLRQALGYPTQAALRGAIARGTVPVKVFQIEGRKGPFALAHELAAWLATQGSPVSASNRDRCGGAGS